MEHTEVREAIAAGEATDEALEHLERCDECAVFADRVDRVRTQAPALVGAAPPAGLADRVLEHVRTSGRNAAPAVVPFRDRLRRLRRPLLAAGSVAAAAALVAGLLVAGPGGPEPAEALALAAERTGSLDTARLDLDGRAEMSVKLPEIDLPTPPAMEFPSLPSAPPAPAPDLEGVPEGFRDEIRQRVEESRRRFAEGQAELEGVGEDARRRMREELERAEDALPREFEKTAVFDGTGAMALPDRLRLEGTVEQTRSHRPDETLTSDYGVVVVGSDAWVRSPDGTWSELPGRHGPFGPVVLDPASVARFVEAAEGAEDLGTETLDGVEVRQYRFGVPPRAFGGDADFSTTAEAWVGVDDDLVRKLRLVSEGSSSGPELDEEGVRGSVEVTWRTQTTVRLSDFGGPVDISPPPADAVTGTAPSPGSFAVLYPFGGHVHLGTPSLEGVSP